MQFVVSPHAGAVFQQVNIFDIVKCEEDSTQFDSITANTNWDAESLEDTINFCSSLCHDAAAARGWWHVKLNQSPDSVQNYALQQRSIGDIISLIHSEVSEGFEAARKDLPSDHIEGFSGLEEEMADTLIRIFDLAGAANLRLGEAFVAKMVYNAGRKDHSLEEREKPGGKKL